MEVNELSKNSRGGTELMLERIHSRVNPDLLNECQIIPSRVRELKEDKIRILWQHDLPGDPESHHLANRGWEKFHKIVFVSNWQMQQYISHYDIPWSRCVVMQNAIDPIEVHQKEFDKIRLIYHTTPHRGLQILVPVFEKLCEKFDNIELDVYSSFSIYGWEERDKQFEELFNRCKEHPSINYHGAKTNEEVREALKLAHIYAYPSIWPETSCLSLIEAMSAGLLCVHSNFAALYETAANWTHMYQFMQEMEEHGGLFYSLLFDSISNIQDPMLQKKMKHQKAYTDGFYNLNNRIIQWEALIASLLNEPREFPKPSFVYKTV